MKKSTLLLLAIATAATTSTAAFPPKSRSSLEAVEDDPLKIPVVPTLKILLQRDVPDVMIEVKGPYKVFDPRSGQVLARGLFGKSFTALPLPTGIKWGEEFPGVYQICITTSSKQGVIINKVPYKGSVTLYQIADSLSLVNEIDVEDYLKITLANDLDPKLHEEALAATAIAARTQAYFLRYTQQDAFWHVDGHAVGYSGYVPTHTFPSIDQAVDTTRNLVLISQQSNEAKGLFCATWTENCAGKTVPYHVLHRSRADYSAPHGAEMAFAKEERMQSEWAFSVSKPQLAELLGMSKITKVVLYADSFSKKVYNIRFFDGEITVDKDYFSFQNLVGKNRLKSSDFIVAVHKDEIAFTGYGSGDGTGVCLFSAQKMAQSGADAHAILAQAFPDTHMIFMPDLKLKAEAISKVQSLKTLPRSGNGWVRRAQG